METSSDLKTLHANIFGEDDSDDEPQLSHAAARSAAAAADDDEEEEEDENEEEEEGDICKIARTLRNYKKDVRALFREASRAFVASSLDLII